MTIHDVYGFSNADMEAFRVPLEQILGIPLVGRYSTYHCGEYYGSDLGSIEEVILQFNLDPIEQEWTEEAFQDYALLLYISVKTYGRAEQILNRLTTQIPTTTHLQREET